MQPCDAVTIMYIKNMCELTFVYVHMSKTANGGLDTVVDLLLSLANYKHKSQSI